MNMIRSSPAAPAAKPSCVPVLLACGIVSLLVYLAGDVIAGMSWQGYAFASQAVSELTALESPARPLLLVLFSLYSLLVVAFGAGVIAAAASTRSLRSAGILLIVYSLMGWVTMTYFPMHSRGVVAATSDIMHPILTYANVIVILAIVGFAAAAFGRPFRLYSLATVLILIGCGLWTGQDVSALKGNLATPILGIKERILIYGFLLWVSVLAVMLLRTKRERSKMQ